MVNDWWGGAGGVLDTEKTKVTWSAAAEKALKRALGCDLEQIKNEVSAGDCELWRYADGGYCVTRVEVFNNSHELVIVASGVKNGLEKLAEWVRFADKNNMSIRIHSSRAGMRFFTKQLGFTVLETVYRYKNGR